MHLGRARDVPRDNNLARMPVETKIKPHGRGDGEAKWYLTYHPFQFHWTPLALAVYLQLAAEHAPAT